MYKKDTPRVQMSDTYKRIQRNMVRRRKKKRTLTITAFILFCCVLLIIIVFTVNKAGEKEYLPATDVMQEGNTDQTQEDTSGAADDAKDEAKDDTKDAEPVNQIPQIRIYPEISALYTEITAENIRSPYVALLDVEKNQIIAGRECGQKIYPASMTKVMTLIVAVENIHSYDGTFTMTEELFDRLTIEEASTVGYEPGEVISAKDLLYGLILPSGADAAEGLAEMLFGSQDIFVRKMNEKCAQLGLQNTHFTNTTGLHDDEQYTTPIEIAVIFDYAMKNETCAEILSTYQYTTTPTPQHPEGLLLTSTTFSRMYGTEEEGIVISAGKTGFTDEARQCMVSYATKEGRHYIAVKAYAADKWHPVFDDFEIYKNYAW